jgi:exopolyphosphatase/guanosine-5'-triphosphate,3'-diphosphate pyrophosphatase
MTVRRACIDIGSNTTRLLVAECGGGVLREIHQERAFTRIGDALRHTGRIAPEKLEEVAEVVSGQLASARRLGAESVRCVATASVRRASNGHELVAAVERLCEGLKVEILSGADEARLAFSGVARTLEEEPQGPLGVVDVGGGSSELAVGTPPDGVSWWVSVPLGSGDLADICLRSDPPSPAELDDARARVREVLAGVRPPRTAVAVAVGGSATSVRRLVGPVLDAEAITAALDTLGALRAADVARRFAMDAQRVALMPAGLVILEAVATLLDVPLRIGRGGLREGILLEGADSGG